MMKQFWNGIKESVRLYFLPLTHPKQAWDELKFEWLEFKLLLKELKNEN